MKNMKRVPERVPRMLIKFTFLFIILAGGWLPSLQAQLNKPVFSHAPGFYHQDISLQISYQGQAPEGLIIHYTLDGSIPGPQSPVMGEPLSLGNRQGDPNTISLIPTNPYGPGHPYNEHWQPPAGEISKLHVVRARAFAPGHQASATATASFLIDPQGAGRYSLPLISVSAPAGAFFDADSGIYVPGNHDNYNQRGSEWERLIHFEFFEAGGGLAFAQDMGVRIHGGTSRTRPRKSLRLYARSDYGKSWVEYPLFPDKNIGEYKRFLLRNSGNDWDGAIFRDAFMQSLLAGTPLDRQYSRPVVVYLNGEYWGVHNLRDRLDERYIETHFGLEEEEFTMLENNGVFNRGNEAGADHYQQMLSYLEDHSMSDPAHFSELQRRMDTDNFIQYQISHIYFANTDWPGNNIDFWRALTDDYIPSAPYGLDGRWRWMVFDTDFGFGLNFPYVTGVEQGPAHNTLAFAMNPSGPAWPNPPWSTFILRRLLENESFRYDFINTFMDMLNMHFHEERVMARLDDFRQQYLPEMSEHIHRWIRPPGLEAWEQELAVMEQYAQQRPAYLRQYLAGAFGLGETALLKLKLAQPGSGSIRLNISMLNDLDQQWQGLYFRDMPIRLEAVPAPGYRFSFWEGLPAATPSQTVISLSADQSLSLHMEDGMMHYWHFNDLADDEFQHIEADYSSENVAYLVYEGSGEGYMDRTDGSSVHTARDQAGGFGLRVRNPSDDRALVFSLPSSGYTDLEFSFELMRTSNGARWQQLYYSADGGDQWEAFGEAYLVGEPWTHYRFDLSGISALNDNAQMKLKIVFTGQEASGSSGNNRFDNIVLSGRSQSLRLSQRPLPAGVEGEAFPEYSFMASGGEPPYVYSLSQSSLPAGLQLSPQGLLQGIPQQAGEYSFRVLVSDQQGQSAMADFVLRVQEQLLLHYWHFNQLADTELTVVRADLHHEELDAGSLWYPGTGNGYMDRAEGSTLNAPDEMSAGYSLRVRNPADSRALVFHLPSTGFEALRFTYAVQRTSSGAQQHQLQYSPDGGINWFDHGPLHDITQDFTVISHELSSLDAVNHNQALYLRILFSGPGSGGSSGNNRFDNVRLSGLRSSLTVHEPESHFQDWLGQNYPNPFRQYTRIPFQLKRPGQLMLEVFDLSGRRMNAGGARYFEAGLHHWLLQTADWLPGMYIYRMHTPDGVMSRTMLLSH